MNGVRVCISDSAGPSDIANFQVLSVGAYPTESKYYQGYLSKVAKYNYAMSDAEVATLYSSGTTPTPFIACPTTSITCIGGTVHCTPTGTPVCCGVGTYFAEGVSSTCQTCAAGTYGSGSSTACTSCTSGLSSPAGVGICCPANTYIVPGTSTCTACPANSWSAAGAAGCTANAGYYDAAGVGNGIWSRYTYNSFNSATKVWADISPNGRNGAAAHVGPSANGITSSCASGNGAAASVCSVQGGVVTQQTDIDQISFCSFPSTFTMCSVTRYTSATVKNEVLQEIGASGGTSNWFHGHWSGNDCTVYYGAAGQTGPWGNQTASAWKQTTAQCVSPTTNWIVACAQNSANDPSIYINGNVQAVTGHGGISPRLLGIGSTYDATSSQFGVMEVTV